MDAKLFIQKKEIHIRDTKKVETLSQIPCSTTLSESIWFKAGKKNKVVEDELSEEADIENDIGHISSSKESDEEPSDQDFWRVLVMILKEIQNPR